MIRVTRNISIDEGELIERFVGSPGPGGQRVNKTSTAVQLRFDVERSRSLPEDVRQRLKQLAGRRLTSEGVLILEARRARSRQRNREAAVERLTDLIRRAARPPKPRHPTRPSRAARRRRLESKRRRGQQKRVRRNNRDPEE